MQIPYLDNSTVQSAGVSPFFGGVQMYWTAESQTRTETEPQFKQLDLKAWELSGYSVSSNVLLQDSVIGLEKFLMTLFAKSLAWFEEYAFLQGNGAGKPQGMLGAAATVSVTRQTAIRCSTPTWPACGRNCCLSPGVKRFGRAYGVQVKAKQGKDGADQRPDRKGFFADMNKYPTRFGA